MLAALKIKEDKKSSFAYVRSKTKCKAQVGPLCNTQGQEVNDALDMAESFNAQFLTVFTADDTSNIPVPEKPFTGNDEEKLVHLEISIEAARTHCSSAKRR